MVASLYSFVFCLFVVHLRYKFGNQPNTFSFNLVYSTKFFHSILFLKFQQCNLAPKLYERNLLWKLSLQYRPVTRAKMFVGLFMRSSEGRKMFQDQGKSLPKMHMYVNSEGQHVIAYSTTEQTTNQSIENKNICKRTDY